MRLTGLSLPAVSILLLCSAAAAGAAVRHARAAGLPDLPSPPRAPVARGTSPSRPAAPPRPAQPRAQPRRPPPAPASDGFTSAEVDAWERRLADDPGTRRALRRIGRYAPLIRHALSDHTVPEEFLYLPLIESEYLASATSRVGAAGMWQFMPATARSYGLEVSTWVDERRDPIRSTLAAARHLRDLHRELGSWDLAAAAYNCGSPRVRRAIAGAQTDRSFWANRSQLPPETRSYVPKLLAAVRLGRMWEYQEQHPSAPLRFREVLVAGGVPLEAVAAAYGVAPDSVLKLNPQLVRGTTPPDRRWPVRIPVAHP